MDENQAQYPLRKITLLIVDDHPVFRQGLRNIFATEEDIQVVAEGASGEQALQLVYDLQPDVLLLDINLPGINQVQMHEEIGMNFAAALRSFLRQDPDIILVGEVRDLETSEICLKAALTGHLVMSTLHTNDALSAIARMVDMGVPHYLLASAIRLIIAQRLVRRLCPSCKEAYEVKRKEVSGYTLNCDIAYKAKGCEECSFIGYKGRTLIAEVVLVDDDLRDMIYRKATMREMLPLVRSKGTMTLLESGLKRVEEGVTSVEEILSSAMA